MSTNTNDISYDAYFWSHIGVIFFHLIISSLLIYMSYRNNFSQYIKLGRYIGYLLFIISFLALVPIFKSDKYDIMTITK